MLKSFNHTQFSSAQQLVENTVTHRDRLGWATDARRPDLTLLHLLQPDHPTLLSLSLSLSLSFCLFRLAVCPQVCLSCLSPTFDPSLLSKETKCKWQRSLENIFHLFGHCHKRNNGIFKIESVCYDCLKVPPLKKLSSYPSTANSILPENQASVPC